MMEEEKFLSVAGLIGEPARAKMLWNLLDGRGYTATELAFVADISATSASNHLAKLLEADLLKVEKQGRHRYFSFSRPEIAYVVESLASLADHDSKKEKTKTIPSGIKYCRTCYDHLAGYVGVKVTDALEAKKLIKKTEGFYDITGNGWKWLEAIDISKDDLGSKRRPVTRQCIDWSERRPHVAGQLGAVLLNRMLQLRWFRKVQFSRELIVTSEGRSKIQSLFGIEV